MGVTLPVRGFAAASVYGDEQTRRLSEAFNELFHSLCDQRLNILPREHDAARVPGAYEFPREFRKLRTPLVQFLVDLVVVYLFVIFWDRRYNQKDSSSPIHKFHLMYLLVLLYMS